MTKTVAEHNEQMLTDCASIAQCLVRMRMTDKDDETTMPAIIKRAVSDTSNLVPWMVEADRLYVSAELFRRYGL